MADDVSGNNSASLYRYRVVVKFKDQIQIPYTDEGDGVGSYVEENNIGPWKRLEADFPGITLRPKLTSVSQEELQDLVRRAVAIDATYTPPNFFTYFVIDVPLGFDSEKLANELSQWDNVQYAYVESEPVQAPSVMPADDANAVNQGYLETHDPAAATYGIGARYAWGFTGGDGAGVTFVDVEQGWYLNHEDLPVPAVNIIAGVDIDSVPISFLPSSISNPGVFKREQRAHGTHSLGVVVGVDNNKGVVGIAPHAPAQVASSWWQDEIPPGSGRFHYAPDIARTILRAIATLQFGDILLLELQLACTSSGGLACQNSQYEPVELEPANFDIIRLATALGIVVVEAAGNGSKVAGAFDLKNRLFRSTNQHILDRDSIEYRDSGAILVGAATKAYPHSRLTVGSPACSPIGDPFSPSNYGKRVDCYAWGQCVFTTGQASGATNAYQPHYSSTSSASAIIAGAAVVVQGVAQQRSPLQNMRLGPFTMRALLRNSAYGTSSMTPSTDLIGVMPNLKKIIDSGLGVTPDVYVRDYVGDDGDPHTGMISASPDIIVRADGSVGNHTIEFGGSATFNDNTLGSQVVSGQDHVVYVRVLNRGGSVSVGTRATVYWAYPSTLLTPNTWTKIGTSLNPVNVPTSTTSLTVLDPIFWPLATLPGPGHYCFIAAVGSEADPDPISDPANMAVLSLSDFIAIIRNNNNVTWRNFNVVTMLPESEMIELAFMAQGWPSEDLPMLLEVEARLPEGARVWLEGPAEFMKVLAENSFYLTEGSQAGYLRLSMNPYGRSHLRESVFPAKFQADMKLFVDIPMNQRENTYGVFARQLYNDQEVGRVHWHLAPPERVKFSRLRPGGVFFRRLYQHKHIGRLQSYVAPLSHVKLSRLRSILASCLQSLPRWLWFALGAAVVVSIIRGCPRNRGASLLNNKESMYDDEHRTD